MATICFRLCSEPETDSDSKNEQNSTQSIRRSANFSKRNYRQRSQSDSPQSNHVQEVSAQTEDEDEDENEDENENENESTDESDSSSDVVKLIW